MSHTTTDAESVTDKFHQQFHMFTVSKRDLVLENGKEEGEGREGEAGRLEERMKRIIITRCKGAL